MFDLLRKTFLGVATAAALASGASAAVVVNGSFETSPGAGINFGTTFSSMPTGPGSSWDVFNPVPGWTVDAGQGLEIQTERTLGLTPYDGLYYAELDGNQNSTISQSVFLSAGLYTLTFAYSPRVNTTLQPVNTNTITYSLGELVSGFATGPSATYPLGSWTVISTSFSVATAGSYVLTFDAAGRSESLGGFVDGIQIAVIPLPAGGLLLIGALGGLAALRRRKAMA